MRSGLWEPASWPAADAIPTMCEMLWAQLPEKPEGVSDVNAYETAMQERLKKTLY